jgi:hypothetical protein
MTKIEEAAKNLHKWVNQYAPPTRPHAMVGIGMSKIIVYMHCRKKQWRSPVPETYEGWPVEWQWNVGRPVAAQENRL